MKTKQNIFAFLAGLLFATGLVISGMTQPAKVIGFLNVWGLNQGISWQAQAGFWDPSLALVMGGALAITLIAFSAYFAIEKPWFDTKFHLPSREDIDGKLLLGAALFGLGWGMAGYCPGPALASVLAGGTGAVLFTSAMLLGMWFAKRFLR